MGFGLPAAIGGWFADPSRPVVLIDGDGSSQMNIQELGTVVAQRIPVKIFVLNNSFLGMLRQWEDMMDGGHHYETCLARTAECDPDCTDMEAGCRRQIPNLTGLKYVYPRLRTLRIRTQAELEAGIAAALADDHPVLVDCWVDQAENVLPMVRPGHGLEQMIES
jgi:acetolactate synthase-1/2/3 large subunit